MLPFFLVGLRPYCPYDVSPCQTGGKEAGYNLLKNDIATEDMTKTD